MGLQQPTGWVLSTIARNYAKTRNGLGSWYLVLSPQEGASRPVHIGPGFFCWLMKTRRKGVGSRERFENAERTGVRVG